MQKPTRFGFCSLFGCLCSFCLSTITGLPQDAKPADAAPAPSQESPTNAPSLQQLVEQNLAMLKALDELKGDREAALKQYTEAIANELNVLREALVSQREQEFQTARDSNRFILTVAATVAGIALIIMLVSALLPVWALKRFAATRAASEIGALFLSGRSNVGTGSDLALLDPPGEKPVVPPLGRAIDKLEQRLLALEKSVSHSPEVGSRKEEGERAPSPAGNTISAPAKPETSSGKYSGAAHVALTLGAGEAISFLPRDVGLTRLRVFRTFLGKFKRLFRRTLP